MKRYILLLLPAFVFASCTREDTSNCPSYQTISHHYTLNLDGTDQLDTHMDSIKVLRFSDDDIYLGYFTIYNPVNDQQVEIEVDAPYITVLSVGGDHSGFQFLDGATGGGLTINQTLLQDIEVRLLHEDYVAYPTTELFMSEPVRVNYSGLVAQNTKISMIQKTKTITVHLLGASSTHNTSISMANAVLDYTGYPIEGSTPRVYTPTRTQGADTLSFEYDVVRLFASDTTGILSIDPLGAVATAPAKLPATTDSPQRTLNNVSTISVVETIMQNPSYQSQSDLDSEDNFEMVIEVDGSVIVSIAINDWEIVNVGI